MLTTQENQKVGCEEETLLRRRAKVSGQIARLTSFLLLARRCLGSFTLMLVLCLSLTYSLIFTNYPWRELAALDIPLWIMRYAAKAPEYMAGPEKRPVVILGSSLILAPSQRLNDIDEAPMDTEGQKETTIKSTFYEREVKKLTGLTLPIKNLAIHGAMVTDQELITKELIASGKAPEFLIITLAPRDFIDNILGTDLENTPTKRVFTFISHSKSLFPRELSIEAIGDCLQGHKKFTDVIRRKFARSLKENACRISRRPDNLWDAAHKAPVPKVETGSGKSVVKQKKEPSKEEIFAEDIAHYKRRYLPPNEKRFQEQLQSLDALLAQAKAAGIQILLVEMPITKENIAILKPSQYNEFKTGVKTLATRYNASLVNFDDVKPGFGKSDFVDSVHVNKQGAERFIPLFTEKLVNSQAFKCAFPETTKEPPKQ